MAGHKSSARRLSVGTRGGRCSAAAHRSASCEEQSMQHCFANSMQHRFADSSATDCWVSPAQPCPAQPSPAQRLCPAQPRPAQTSPAFPIHCSSPLAVHPHPLDLHGDPRRPYSTVHQFAYAPGCPGAPHTQSAACCWTPWLNNHKACKVMTPITSDALHSIFT